MICLRLHKLSFTLRAMTVGVVGSGGPCRVTFTKSEAASLPVYVLVVLHDLTFCTLRSS
jgi:hypothetical protein